MAPSYQVYYCATCACIYCLGLRYYYTLLLCAIYFPLVIETFGPMIAKSETGNTHHSSPNRTLSEPSLSLSNPHRMVHNHSLPHNLSHQLPVNGPLPEAATLQFENHHIIPQHAPNQRQLSYTAPIYMYQPSLPNNQHVKHHTIQHIPSQQQHLMNNSYNLYQSQQSRHDIYPQQQYQAPQEQFAPSIGKQQSTIRNETTQQLQYPTQPNTPYQHGATNNTHPEVQLHPDDEALTSVSQQPSTPSGAVQTRSNSDLQIQSQEKVSTWLENSPDNDGIDHPLPPHDPLATSQYQTQPSYHHRPPANFLDHHERSGNNLQYYLETPRHRLQDFPGDGKPEDRDKSTHDEQESPPINNPGYSQQYGPPVPHASSSYTSTHMSGDSLAYSQLSTQPYLSNPHQQYNYDNTAGDYVHGQNRTSHPSQSASPAYQVLYYNLFLYLNKRVIYMIIIAVPIRRNQTLQKLIIFCTF